MDSSTSASSSTDDTLIVRSVDGYGHVVHFTTQTTIREVEEKLVMEENLPGLKLFMINHKRHRITHPGDTLIRDCLAQHPNLLGWKVDSDRACCPLCGGKNILGYGRALNPCGSNCEEGEGGALFYGWENLDNYNGDVLYKCCGEWRCGTCWKKEDRTALEARYNSLKKPK